MIKHFNKLVFICVLFCLIMLVPVSFAQDNVTVAENLTSDSQNLISSDYYFNPSLPEDGDGSIESPFNYIDSSRVKANSVLHLSDGVYNLTSNVNADNVTIIGSNSDKTVINQNFQFNSKNGCTLSKLTLNAVRVNVDSGTFTADNVIFSGKYSGTNVNGGAIYSSGKNITLINCNFINNYAQNGGSIYIENGFLDIYNSLFTNCIADTAGGAIYSKGSTIKISNSAIKSSSAPFGGAITSLKSTLNFYNLTANSNKAVYDGGAVYHLYGDVNITSSQFTDNSANNGGALYAFQSEFFIINKTKMSNNKASNHAGAVFSIANDPFYTDSIKDKSLNNEFKSNVDSYSEQVYENSYLEVDLNGDNYKVFVGNSAYVTNLPSRYSSAEKGYVTPVKAQGSGGNCWSFTALATLEACILKASGISYDFSEENMKNIMGLYSIYGWNMETNVGGYDDMGLGYLVGWLGPVNESLDKYSPTSILSPLLDAEMHVQNFVFLKRDNYTDNQAIKEAVYNYGAVGTAIYWSSSNLKGSNYYYNGDTGANHAVTIVGWDDNYSKSNFKTQPEGNGAWIIKNSWGASSGDKGFYYVSYYDTKCAQVGKKDVSYSFILNESSKFDEIYQYDIQGRTDFYLTPGNEIWYKNIFTADSNKYLRAVSTYFEKACNWELSVYVNNALQLTQSGLSKAGYFTIDLIKPLTLKTGDKFEIVFKILSDDGEVSFPISEYISLNTLTYKEGISFFSMDGKEWTDLFEHEYKYSTHTYNSQVACIKAFTVSNPIDTKISLSVVGNENITGATDIVAVVLDNNNAPLNSGKVEFEVEGVKYNVNVVDGVAKLTHVFKNSGIFSINAVFSGNAYKSSSASINAETIKLTASPQVVYGVSDSKYTIKLTDSKGKALAGKEIIISPGHSVKTDSNGVTTFTLNWAAGDYSIIFASKGYASFVGKNYIQIKHSVFLPSATTYEYGAQYKVNFLDKNGNKLSYSDVEFKIGNNVYRKTTDLNGMASIDLILNNGNYEVAVTNLNTGEILKDKFTIFGASVKLPNQSTYAFNANYIINLTDSNGNPLSNGNVIVQIGSKSDTRTPDANGQLSIPITQKAGTYNVIVTNLVTGESKQQTIDVVNRITENADLKMYFGAGKYFKVRVLNDDGSVSGAGKIVTFKINSKTYTAKTDANGYAKLKINLNPKSYTVTTSFNGFKVSNKIVVKPTIVAKDVSKKKATNVKYSAKLLSSSGKILKNKKITFKVKGKTYKAKTNSKGIATITLKNFKVGSYKVVMTYGKAKITKTIKIKK